MRFRIFLALLLLPALALAQPAATPARASGVDKASMNASADPCADFYQYACGSWVAKNPLPADRARWGRFNELQDHNENVLLGILQNAAANGSSELERKIGDFYASCMDTAAIGKAGLAPIQMELDRINGLTDIASIAAEMARLQREGTSVVFSFGAQADSKDSNRTIAGLRPGGLSLPDRDYYLKSDPVSVELRKQYLRHVENMFRLAGDPPQTAPLKAAMVLGFETILAKDALDRVSMRDPNKTYNILERSTLSDLYPSFPWEDYFKATEAPAFDSLNVAYPEGLRLLSSDLAGQPIEAWKAYFAYHELHESAEALPEAFENEVFDFWQRTLAGVKEPRPRANRCAAATDRTLGDLLSQEYVALAFSADAKARITTLVDNLEKSMGDDIATLAWMTEDTRAAALKKLKAITNNVGYPKKWRDYGNVTIARDDYLGNSIRAAQAAYDQRLAKIGKSVDKTEWTMTAPTVNAFYSAQNNSINFPAGILQPPFFDPQRDMAVNYGGVGAVIGHEMTHGFDDQGRKFDGAGNLRDWWTARDGAEFEQRAACIANEYSGFTSVDDVKLNGRLTLGENTADNGGLRVAYMALEDAQKSKKLDKLEGFTPEQRFFLGFAQVWCENMSPQELRQRAMTDSHSPGKFRVNGTLRNMPEFQKAFACKPDAPMVSANACRVW